jgi:hypothetical protein
MSNVFIDWSKAPEGTTHAYIVNSKLWINGQPVHAELWEKWENGNVYEWDGSSWLFAFSVSSVLGFHQRVVKPEASRERVLIGFAANADEPRTLLNFWLEGRFGEIRDQWPSCPPDALTGDKPEPISTDWPTEGDRCFGKD